MGDKLILQSVENVLNYDVVESLKDTVVAFVATIVVVQKVNKDLSIVANPIDDIGTEFR